MGEMEAGWSVRRWRHAQLPVDLFSLMAAAARREFDQFAIVRQTDWATPDWSWLIGDPEPAAFYHLVERIVRIDGAEVRVAGLHNLVTLPARRGVGAASELLRRTQPQWFESLGAQLALLLCADALIPFYARLGWHLTRATVTFAQPQGTRMWAANCMLLDPSGQPDSRREIDLGGLPW
jgi:hypothetical protein